MNSINWKKILPHIIAIISFIVISVLYCQPALQGKVLQQHDIVQFEGASKDISDYNTVHGEAPLWTNGMFSGMPTYQIWMPGNNVLPHYANSFFTLGLPQPVQFFFLACLMFYFLSQVLRVNPYVGIFGAIAFGFSTYNPVIISAGHVTKMWCIAYMPAILGSLILIYRKNYLTGTALLALFTSIQIGLNHLQITYYLFFALVFMTVAYIISWVRNKEYSHMIKSLSLAVFAGLIGLMVNAVTLLTTYEYSKETIRGGSLSLADTASKTGGLTKDYAFSYSYKPMETFTIMVPKIYGGSNGIREFGDNSKVSEALSAMPPQLSQQLGGLQNAYWGSLDFTSGPPYLGAIICFLFLLSIAYLKSEHKWWMIALSALAIVMAWGKFFPGFNYFLFDHLPLYNKFRAPSMSLVLLQLIWPIASILTIQQIIFGEESKEEKWKKFRTGLIITGVVLFILIAAYFSFDYLDEGIRQLKKQIAEANDQVKQYVNSGINALIEDRKSFFAKDLLKTFGIVALFAGMLGLYIKEILKSSMAVITAAILLVAIDLLPVGKLYIDKTPAGEDAYVEKTEEKTPFTPGKADQLILPDKSEYRVLNLAVSPFQDATTSYLHRSIGGYHAAKIARYQDLFENKISGEINQLSKDSSLANGLSQSKYTGLNMLNTKYIIASNPQQGSNEPASVITNNKALGSCWLVQNISFAKTPKDEMEALNNLDASKTAVVSEDDKNKVTQPVYDSSATITKVDNKDNHNILEYKSKASANQFAVFSEVYYSEGWNAYVNGKKTDYVKTNYALRGMNIPAGEHKIEFKFEPASYGRGRMLTNIGQILVLLLLAGTLFTIIRKGKTQDSM
ncbi:MAG: YfhO family protein [Sphingobacteriales bacterium]